MKVGAVIVAGGAGIRAGGNLPKQYQLLGGISVLRRTLEAFTSHPRIAKIVTVIGQGHEEAYKEATHGISISAPVVGGSTRQESCRRGVEAFINDAPDLILIHDAARPFISHAVIDNVIDGLQTAEAVIPGIAVADTIKRARHGVIESTVDRSSLFFVQTPQGFIYSKILSAHAQAVERGQNHLTDDAAVAEAFGMKVQIVPGDPLNQKLTTIVDFRLAEIEVTSRGLTARPDIRMGQGIDFHTFTKGNSLWLCGVNIPHTHKLKGHSDADVALHAVTDALLGAIGESDIGTHFPPTDATWKNANSSIFVSKAMELLRAKDGIVANVDVTVLAELPKINVHLSSMKTTLARLLAISIERVAIKATTTEQMGSIGRKEGMAAFATVTVRLPL